MWYPKAMRHHKARRHPKTMRDPKVMRNPNVMRYIEKVRWFPISNNKFDISIRSLGTNNWHQINSARIEPSFSPLHVVILNLPWESLDKLMLQIKHSFIFKIKSTQGFKNSSKLFDKPTSAYLSFFHKQRVISTVSRVARLGLSIKGGKNNTANDIK